MNRHERRRKRKEPQWVIKRGSETYDTSLKSLPVLDPDEACRQFDKDPSKLWVTLGNISSLYGLTLEELHVELASGRLLAHMLIDDDGTQMIAVSVEDLVRWTMITGRQAIEPS
jgi:hypothetical protein